MTRRSAHVRGRKATLVGGQKLMNVHKREDCAGEYCTIHRFSLHHMRDWPQNWRSDRALMERVCPEHGIGHPDPDELALEANGRGIHGCCGCCSS